MLHLEWHPAWAHLSLGNFPRVVNGGGRPLAGIGKSEVTLILSVEEIVQLINFWIYRVSALAVLFHYGE
jgi:hypothetical protein